MKATALVPYKLPSQSLGAGQTWVTNMRDLPKTYLGKFAHLARVHEQDNVTTTFSAGTATPSVLNQSVIRHDFFDGDINRFTGSYNVCRAWELMQNGNFILPDPLNGTTTETRTINRQFDMGPINYAGSFSDFALPTALLENAQFNCATGGLGDLTGLTATVNANDISCTAFLSLMDEIRIPPVYEVKTQNVSGNYINLPGRAAYDIIAVMDSYSLTSSFSAGDFGAISLDLGSGFVVPAVSGPVLGWRFLGDKRVGEVGYTQGEPANATDLAGRIVNRASATALAAAANLIQPVLWSQDDQLITKCHIADSIAILQWTGTGPSNAPVLTGRFLPQPQSVIISKMNRALNALNLKADAVREVKVKTLSKEDYTGPSLDFMPWAVKIK